MISEVDHLLKSAREELNNHNITNAESLYKKAINIISKKISSVDFRQKQLLTMKLWLTKAELLYFRSTNPIGEETFEDFRNKRLDSLRYLYKCSKVNEYYYSIYHPRLMENIVDTISRFGCILPEINRNVVVTCPIYLRRLDRDSEIPLIAWEPVSLLRMKKVSALFVKKTCLMMIVNTFLEKYMMIRYVL